MVTHDITVKHGGAPPVACALTPADLAAQATRWRQSAAQAMTERTETGYGLRLTFRTQPGVADERPGSPWWRTGAAPGPPGR